MQMKAIVLAGGRGTRLEKVVSDLPKPLAPVRGEPFLFILLRFLSFHGIDQILISTHHLADKFAEHLQKLNGFSGNISIVKEPALLGTGGAVRFNCQNMNPEDYVLIVNGDTFFDFDLSGFVKKFQRETALALKEVPDAARYGTVEVAEGKVEKFVEKMPSHRRGLIYAGYSIVKVSDILRVLPEGNSSLEKDFYPALLARNQPIGGEVYAGNFIDIGIPEDYEKANTTFDFSKFSV